MKLQAQLALELAWKQARVGMEMANRSLEMNVYFVYAHVHVSIHTHDIRVDTCARARVCI